MREWKLIPGKESLGKGTEWVPSAHQSRPEAQDEWDQVGRATGRDHGQHRGHALLDSAERRTGVPGFERGGKAPKRGDNGIIFPSASKIAYTNVVQKKKRLL